MPDSIRVPITLRSHEKRQLATILPEIRDKLRRATLDEKADCFDTAYNRLDEERETLSLQMDDWLTILQNMDRVTDEHGKNRISFLQQKLYDRLRDRVDEIE